MEKTWDLNVFFEDLGDEVADVITINPVVYVVDQNRSNRIYTDIIIKATFAESRYIRSQRPVEEYGYDWFEDKDYFLSMNPTSRIKDLLAQLPDPNTLEED
jgi:hypothetical protein